jgi:hypothetical protein
MSVRPRSGRHTLFSGRITAPTQYVVSSSAQVANLEVLRKVTQSAERLGLCPNWLQKSAQLTNPGEAFVVFGPGPEIALLRV